MTFFRKLFPNFSLKTLAIVLLSTAVISTVVYAAPSAPPGSTGYTLDDIYNKYIHNIDAIEGGGAFSPSGPPGASMRTIKETYEAIDQKWASAPKGQRELPSNYTVSESNETVIDHNTGLMWKRCLEGLSGSDCHIGAVEELAWQVSMDRCQNLSYAGYSDWYLPTIDEMISIVDYSKHSPAIDEEAFPNMQQGKRVWSNTAWDAYMSGIMRWAIDFTSGGAGDASPYNNNTQYALCVRQHT